MKMGLMVFVGTVRVHKPESKEKLVVYTNRLLVRY